MAQRTPVGVAAHLSIAEGGKQLLVQKWRTTIAVENLAVDNYTSLGPYNQL